MKRFLSVAVIAAIMLTVVAPVLLGGLAQNTVYGADTTVNVMPQNWAAVDGLGREISQQNTEKTDKERFVGMFYWTWHESHQLTNTVKSAGDIVKEYPEAKNNFNHPAWDGTPSGTPYFWGEPLLGRYTTRDKWVLRKHAEMLAAAGVDVIICDCTNGTFIWKSSTKALVEVYAEARAQGVKTPQIAFMLNFAPNADSKNEIKQLYTGFYQKEEYADLWFKWEGKPLIMAWEDCLDQPSPKMTAEEVAEIKNYFTFRKNEPTYFAKDTRIEDKTWGWCSVYPQTKFGVRSDGSVEQMCVSVAQNATDTELVAMNADLPNVHGRFYSRGEYSYTYNKYGADSVTVDSNSENALIYGINFQQQWDNALEVDPDFIFITGWNEWIAGRHQNWCNTENAFPDQFSEEFSRDIEPSAGILSDHFYMQLCENIRRYKGISSNAEKPEQKTVDVTGGANAWSDVAVTYDDYLDYTEARKQKGHGNVLYTADAVRNDIIHCKFAFDKDNLYFMAQTSNALSDAADSMWMRLFISLNSLDADGWEGFDYIINRNSPQNGTSDIEKLSAGFAVQSVGKASVNAVGDTVTVTVPKSALGITDKLPKLYFKWVDNAIAAENGNIADVYCTGDSAPNGRFMYVVDKQTDDITDVTPAPDVTPGVTPQPGMPDNTVIIGIVAVAVIALVTVVVCIVIVKRKNKQ